jgi:Cft2 family RNA processing exonuclease
VRDPLNGVFFAGYLDPDTLGFKLAHCQPGDSFAFERNGPQVEVRTANIQRFHFSAHANRDELRGVIEHFQPRHTVFMHGDMPALQWMHDNCTGPWTRSLLEGNTPLHLES